MRRGCAASWLGVLFAVPLVAVFGMAASFGAMFVPFDLFDALVPILPGDLATAGIDALVAVLSALGLDIADTVKVAEGALACLLFVGLLAFAAATWATFARPRPAGLAAFAGIPLTGVALATEQASTVSPAVNVLVAATGFGAWAIAVERSRLRWTELNAATRLDRRRFLIHVGGAAATVTVAGTAVVRWLRPRVPSSPEALATEGRGGFAPAPGTRAEVTPVADHYRIDINLRPPAIDATEWRLHVTGLVDRPRAFSLEVLRAFPSLDQWVTLSCISNEVGGPLIGTTRWTGVPLRLVLEELGLRKEARFVRFEAMDGFHESVPVDEALADERVMLTWAWNGEPLTEPHGFPLRLYRPGHYGMKQPKWITRIELRADDEPGYWVARGWDRDAVVKSTSVIDTVAVESAYEQDGDRFVPIGGIAYSGARGIASVAIRIDGGPWQEVTLQPPLSPTTWVLWRYDWPLLPGRHLFEVSCVDGRGQPQITDAQPPHPSGASGLHALVRHMGPHRSG